MFKVLIIAVLIACCKAGDNGYGASGQSGGNDGSSQGGYGSSGGYGGAMAMGKGYGKMSQMSQQPNIIPAAVKTRRTVEIKEVPIESEPIQPQIIEVDASILPLTIHFKSASSNIKVIQSHMGGGGDTQETSSEDEPYKLIHKVTKPIYQEIREIITPYRKVIQEIRPVKEDVQTIVSKGERKMYGGYGGGMNGMSKGGMGGGYAANSGLSNGEYGGGMSMTKSLGGSNGGYGGGSVMTKSSGGYNGGYGGGSMMAKSSGGLGGGYGGQSKVSMSSSGKYAAESQALMLSNGGLGDQQGEDMYLVDENGGKSSMYMQYGASSMVPIIRYY